MSWPEALVACVCGNHRIDDCNFNIVLQRLEMVELKKYPFLIQEGAGE